MSLVFDGQRDEVVPPHTKEVFDPATFGLVVNWLIAEIRDAGYQAVAASGHSGLVPAAAVSFALGVPLLAVRKEDERPKGDSRMVNGILPHGPVRYALIDDFVASGETVNRVHKYVQRAFPQAVMAGLLTYGVHPDSADYMRNNIERFCVWAEEGQPATELARGLRIHTRPRKDS